MAKAGGGSAYIRLQVPDDGLNQSIQYWGAQHASTLRGLQDDKENRRKEKEKKLQDWEDKYGLKAGDFQNKYTGFKTFDDMNTDFSMHITDQYVEKQKQAREALASGDLITKRKLEGEMVQLKNMFGEASKSQEYFSELYEKYKDAASKGLVSGASKDFEDIVQEAIQNKNIALRVVDGNLVYTGLKEGEDGIKEPFTVPYQDLMDSSFSWIEKQKIAGKGGLVDGVLENLGTISKDTQDGYYMITTQEWDDEIHG